MKFMTITEFKTHFSAVIRQVKSGEMIAVTSGKQKKIVGYFVSAVEEVPKKRKLGILEGKASVIFHPNFKMTEEEFLGMYDQTNPNKP